MLVGPLFYAVFYRRNKQMKNYRANWSNCSSMQRKCTPILRHSMLIKLKCKCYHRVESDTRWPFFRCTVDLERVLTTLEDQELKENVEVMRNLQEVILELKVSICLRISLRKTYNVIINNDKNHNEKLGPHHGAGM